MNQRDTGNMFNKILFLFSLSFLDVAFGQTWICKNLDPERNQLTFSVDEDNDQVAWTHERLGELEPLLLIDDTDGMLTFGTQGLPINYSRFFHIDKLTGRMGDTTFRGDLFSKLQADPGPSDFDQVTTVWKCSNSDDTY